jgi:multidrug transporter EmrE-like cation transporter
MVYNSGVFLPIMYGILMAMNDVITFSFVKYISLGTFKSYLWNLVPMYLYSFQPILLLSAMRYESLTVMNLTWNVLSDILVTSIGLLFFKEQIGSTKLLGVIMAVVALALMRSDDHWFSTP